MPPSPTRKASPPRRTSTTRSQSPTRKADITDLSKKFGELETMWKDTLERSSTPRRRASRSSSMRRLSASGTPRGGPSRNISRKNSMVRRSTPTPSLPTDQGVGKSAAETAEAEFLERAQQGRPPRPESAPSDAPPPSACWKCGLDLTTAKVPPKFCRECGSRLA